MPGSGSDHGRDGGVVPRMAADHAVSADQNRDQRGRRRRQRLGRVNHDHLRGGAPYWASQDPKSVRALCQQPSEKLGHPRSQTRVLDNPHIALRESDRRKIGYRLYRRVVEIRDGITHLSEFITPDEVAADLSGRAHTAAQQLRRAMAEKTAHNSIDDYPDGFAPLVGDNPNASVDEEIRWLCQLAKHYTQLGKVQVGRKAHGTNISDHGDE
jgi:Family of unknown function (DUF6545)